MSRMIFPALLVTSSSLFAGGSDVYLFTLTGNPGPASSTHTFDGTPEVRVDIPDLRPGTTIQEQLTNGNRLTFDVLGPDGLSIFADEADPSDNTGFQVFDVALGGPIPRAMLDTAEVTIGFANAPDRVLAYVPDFVLGTGQFSATSNLGTNLLPLGAVGPRLTVNFAMNGGDWIADSGELANRLSFSFDFELLPNGTSFCSGNGTGAACPCDNEGEAGRGCINSSGIGARLQADGTPSLLADTLAFNLDGGPPASFAVLMSAVAQLGDGNGILGTPPMDGLRCIGGGLVRHGARAIDANGNLVAPWDQANQGGIVSNLGARVGSVRHFQAYMRDLPESGCGTGINTSNAVSLLIVF